MGAPETGDTHHGLSQPGIVRIAVELPAHGGSVRTAPPGWLDRRPGRPQLRPHHNPATTRTFAAEGAFNKAGLLGALMLVVGALAYVADLPLGLVWPLMLVALGAGLWASFRPKQGESAGPGLRRL